MDNRNITATTPAFETNCVENCIIVRELVRDVMRATAMNSIELAKTVDLPTSMVSKFAGRRRLWPVQGRTVGKYRKALKGQPGYKCEYHCQTDLEDAIAEAEEAPAESSAADVDLATFDFEDLAQRSTGALALIGAWRSIPVGATRNALLEMAYNHFEPLALEFLNIENALCKARNDVTSS